MKTVTLGLLAILLCATSIGAVEVTPGTVTQKRLPLESRTNVLLVEFQLDSTMDAYGGYAEMTFKVTVTNHSGSLNDCSIQNVQLRDEFGNVVDNPIAFSGFGSSDGKMYWATFHTSTYRTLSVFTLLANKPVTLRLYADIGNGFVTGDSITTSEIRIKDFRVIIEQRAYFTGASSGLENTLVLQTDEAEIKSITPSENRTLIIRGVGKPGRKHHIEKCSGLNQPWIKITTTPIPANDSGDFEYSHTPTEGETMGFLRITTLP